MTKQETSNDLIDAEQTVVPTFLWNFAQDQSLLVGAAFDLQRFLADLAGEASIRVHKVEARAKSLDSYRNKSLLTVEGKPKYRDPATQIMDCIAARVILYTTRARKDMADLIGLRTRVLERVNPGLAKHNGYDSEHFVINKLVQEDARTRYPDLAGYLQKYPGFEVQLRSVAAHAWAEYEHDIRYKEHDIPYKPGAYFSLSEERRAQVDQWFIEAGGLRKYMDHLFDQIQDLVEAEVFEENAGPEIDEGVDDELPVGDAGERGGNPLDIQSMSSLASDRIGVRVEAEEAYLADILGQLARLNIDTVGKFSACLEDVDFMLLEAVMGYADPSSGARRLDDVLLSVLAEQYVEAASSEDRKAVLELRLRRMRGKFNIYQLVVDGVKRRPVSAARAVRQLAARVVDILGIDRASIDGCVSADANSIPMPRQVESENGPFYVTGRFSRYGAESVMKDLLARVPDSGISVLRAGDELV